MEYIFHVGDAYLKMLSYILDKVSDARGVRMGAAKATTILIQVLDEATEAGILTPAPSASTDLIFSGGRPELLKLAQALDSASAARGVRMGTIKSTMILIQLLDDAQKAGIFVPVTPGGKK